MYVNCNTNPVGARVGDCTVRAISKILDQDWKTTYIDLCLYGLANNDMPSANNVWGDYLMSKGFTRHVIDTLPSEPYTVEDFTKDNPKGDYILALSGHVVAVRDGNYYDSWDSGKCTPIFYWRR